MNINSLSTSGDFRSTTESGMASLTDAATTSKHFLRSNIIDRLEPFDFLFFNSVSSIPLLLYPTANYNVTSYNHIFSPEYQQFVRKRLYKRPLHYMNNQENVYAREEANVIHTFTGRLTVFRLSVMN